MFILADLKLLHIPSISDNVELISFSEVVFFFFVSLSLLLCFLIIFSKDVIYCLLGLISVYLLAALLLLSFYVEFLAYSIIVVSLGAVAVLFLYVVLMVNLKGSRIRDSFYYKFNISSFLLGISLIISVLFYERIRIELNFMIFHNPLFDFVTLPYYRNILDVALGVKNNSLKLYGILLYDENQYFIYIILIGILLLSALIGCILLTYDEMDLFKKKK